MTCKILENDNGEVVTIACSSSWGMGVTNFPEDDELAEYGCVYGFGMGGDPHDFEPDYDCNTPAEIKAWEDAKAACRCGREGLSTNVETTTKTTRDTHGAK